MNKILVSFCFLLLVGKATAQNRFAVVKYNKIDVPAVLGEFPFVENTTKDALVDYFEKKGYKSKSNKGYTIFSGVRVEELGNVTLDLYLMFDRKSRQEKDKAVVTLLMSKGYENFASDTSDPVLIADAKKYLEKLIETVAAYDLELKITEQESIFKKASNKMTDLVNDGEKLVKRKKEIEADIVKNTNEQSNQKTEQEKQSQILNNLKQKRKIAATTKSGN